MKKIFLIISLSYSFNVFSTEWVRVINENKQSNYIDNKSIKNQNGNISFVRLVNFLKPNKYGGMSTTILMNVKCSEKKIMYVSYDTFKFNMAKGKKISSHKIKKTNWIFPKSNDYKLKLIDYVCNFLN